MDMPSMQSMRRHYCRDRAFAIGGPTGFAFGIGGFVAYWVCRWRRIGMPHEAWIVAFGAVVLALMNLSGDRHFIRIIRRWCAQRRARQEQQS